MRPDATSERADSERNAPTNRQWRRRERARQTAHQTPSQCRQWTRVANQREEIRAAALSVAIRFARDFASERAGASRSGSRDENQHRILEYNVLVVRIGRGVARQREPRQGVVESRQRNQIERFLLLETKHYKGFSCLESSRLLSSHFHMMHNFERAENKLGEIHRL
jgi:hypothetical protein